MNALFHDIDHIWLSNMTVDIRRYVIFAIAVWLVLWVLLRSVMARRKIRDDTPSNRQMVSEFLYSIRLIAVFSTVSVGITVLDRAGFYPLSDASRSWGAIWFATSLLLMIVGQDAYIYWVHRAMHHPRLFRRVHLRHHRSNNPTPFTAYSFDLGEAFLMVLFVVLWPMIVPTPWPVTGLFMLHQIFRNTLLHAGYELMPARADGRPMFDWLTTTVHHDLHHGQAGWNYAPWFTWWDRWLGTEHPQYHARFAATVRRPLKTGPLPEGASSPVT
jgi:sterol desaturase/sphingolipid hydroxylase (fatty acid hydroxylase superfamily)